ncbi:MAG: hypothetical protein ACRD4Q_02460 [Candidatus Acidiferrales bacterium]
MPSCFAVVWYSPRKFRNEGDYIWCHVDELQKLHEDWDPCRSNWQTMSHHRTPRAAESSAVRLARRDHRESEIMHEESWVRVCSARDVLDDLAVLEADDMEAMYA